MREPYALKGARTVPGRGEDGNIFSLFDYLQGVSTRRIQEIVAHFGIEQLSPASVSRIAKNLDEQAHAFLQRPIEQRFPISLWMLRTTKSERDHGTSPKLFW